MINQKLGLVLRLSKLFSIPTSKEKGDMSLKLSRVASLPPSLLRVKLVGGRLYLQNKWDILRAVNIVANVDWPRLMWMRLRWGLCLGRTIGTSLCLCLLLFSSARSASTTSTRTSPNSGVSARTKQSKLIGIVLLVVVSIL